MINHFIFLSSSYADGTRIAYDLVNPATNEIKDIQDTLYKKCGKDVVYTTHSVMAANSNWASVQAHNPYFKKVKLISSLDDFRWKSFMRP